MEQQLRTVARRLGVFEHAKRAKAVVSPTSRRAQRDDRHLRLLLSFLLRADSSCLDIGANRGDVLAEIVRIAPHGRHIAYEPLPALADDLRRRFPQVDVRAAALSDEAGEAEFVHVVDRPAYSGLREQPLPAGSRTERIRVPLQRLDDAVPADWAPALVKIDVEGAELQVLQGGVGLLRRTQPVVVLEHGAVGAGAYGTRPEQVHDLLVREVGLRVFDLDGDGPYDRSRFVDTYAAGTIWNWVAHP